MATRTLRPGTSVVVPWGLDQVRGEILEVWGDPPRHVRVRLHLGDSSDLAMAGSDEAAVILLSADLVEVAPAA